MRKARVAALVCALLTAGSVPAAAAEWTPAEAVARLHEDPERAAAVLRPLAASDDGAAFHLMVLLHGWLPPTPAAEAERQGLVAATVDRIAGYPPEPDAPPPPDPGDTSMRGFVRVLNFVERRGRGPLMALPGVACRTLRRNPGYLQVDALQFGITADGNLLPVVDCFDAGPDLPPAVEAYLGRLTQRAAVADTGARSFFDYWSDHLHRLLIRVVPQRLLTLPAHPGYDPRPTHRPLETWSMLSLANRRAFEEYAALYESALPALAAHYRARFGMAAADALAAARIALLLPAREGHWGPPDRQGLRYLILEGAPAAEIAALIDAAPSRDAVPMTWLGMAYYDAWRYTGAPDPLISVSVHRPDVLRLLLDRSPLGGPRSGRLRRGDQTVAPNARNRIGKTPLMTAAEIDQLASVRLLLDRGADPNAALDGPGLRHDRRTALHYAAANASASVIEALLAAGADPTREDSRGLGAVDYLRGRGPTGPNPRLAPADIRRLSGRMRR